MTFQNNHVRFYVSLIVSDEGRHTTHTAHIKSNNPHLTCGEIHMYRSWTLDLMIFPVVFFLPTKGPTHIRKERKVEVFFFFRVYWGVKKKYSEQNSTNK